MPLVSAGRGAIAGETLFLAARAAHALNQARAANSLEKPSNASSTVVRASSKVTLSAASWSG